ncbi:DJ-1/PfpI family protein [Enterococcus sp. HY326]|uniref:DJ-1/PfpI family protein n=1 Tax=Enterococcus sp. HY326 TaxID=2971265 RepID=UPI00223F3F47|nr:DJ-1/PfpI family protein [Enterococcus sp. HY326]
MKILLFCCVGFETMEFSPFIDVMGWAKNDFGFDVEVVTCGFNESVKSSFGVSILIDKLYKDVQVDDYDALAIPGGFEEFDFYKEAYDNRFLDLIRQFDIQNKPIATICVGALPVGKSGVLVDRNATTYHLKDGYRQKELASFGVNIKNDRIVIDSNIISSYCPETAADVAFELLKKISNEELMQQVKSAMGYSW